jgi:hypothetical protein
VSEQGIDVSVLWSAYTEARAKAEASGRIEDGIAAGKAWGRFLREFEDTDRPPLRLVHGGHGSA